ncbi:hypothetical protein BS50DRAFT_672683 [Corynespora cassiicola Philippines]|uniref:Rhodopsin domain-containing protein n=1 Tax=Corynespora cassiicola Philippines TaxID=1448308 RepID=A0A2T2P339_CORCC|nr:hypothetical protein BS50DRAFT_672683 [Corynespora cassiicola Philippines]
METTATDGSDLHELAVMAERGSLLTVISWFLACTLLFCLVIRLVVRYTTQKAPGVDDMLLLLSAVLAIGSTVAISCAVQSGLGQRSRTLTVPNIRKVQKAMYAATIMYVLTVGLSKIAITIFLLRLACRSFHRIAVRALGLVIISWTIAITAGVVFQCKLPNPWALFTGKCIPMLPFWATASAVDMFTDLAMITIPIHILWHLQLENRKKRIVITLFSIRIVLLVISIVRLNFIRRLMTSDPAYDSIPYAITTQCHSTLSVIVACSPALKPFVDTLRTGVRNTRLEQRVTGTAFGRGDFDIQVLDKELGAGTRTKKRGGPSRVASSQMHQEQPLRIEGTPLVNEKLYAERVSGQTTSNSTTLSPPTPPKAPQRPPISSKKALPAGPLPATHPKNKFSVSDSPAPILPLPRSRSDSQEHFHGIPSYGLPLRPNHIIQARDTDRYASTPRHASRRPRRPPPIEARPDLTTFMEQVRIAYFEEMQISTSETSRVSSTRTRSPPRPPPPPEELRPHLSVFIAQAGWVRRDSAYGQWKRNDSLEVHGGLHIGMADQVL